MIRNAAVFAIRRLPCCVALVLIVSASVGCSNGGSENPVARVGINTATGWSDSPYISRDGNRLYFMYSRYDFGPWITSGGVNPPVLAGPDRPGLHHSNTNPFDESDIYMATKNPDGTWGEPVNLGFNGAYGDSSGMEIDGGNTFIWLQGTGTTNNIVMATKNPDNTWSAPVDLGPDINDHTAGVFQDNPHLSPDGLGLWFVSNRVGGSGARDLWFSLFGSGTWSAPVNMGSPFSSAGDDDQIWIAPVGATPDIYWNGPNGLNHCVWNGSGCAAAPETVVIPGCAYAAEVSITDDGQYLYFACGDLTTGRVSIMYSVKQPNDSWGQALPVD